MTAAHALLNVGFNTAIAELDSIINRRFASQRTIRIEQAPNGWYCALMDDNTLRFPPGPNLDTVIRFVRAFAEKEGVTVDEDSVEFWRAEAAGMGFSLAVPPLPQCSRCGDAMDGETTTLNGRPTHIRCPRDYPMLRPDNVVPIGGRDET
jgi:hypothetical protein